VFTRRLRNVNFRAKRKDPQDTAQRRGIVILRHQEECSIMQRRWFVHESSTWSGLLDMRKESNLASRVTEQLAFLGSISNRAIFGAVGIFIDERLLGIVADDVLYLHTGPTNRDDYLSRGCRQFKPYPNAFDLTTDHHQVPEEVLNDPAELKAWGQRALLAAVEAARVKQLAGIERSRHAKQAKKKVDKARH